MKVRRGTFFVFRTCHLLRHPGPLARPLCSWSVSEKGSAFSASSLAPFQELPSEGRVYTVGSWGFVGVTPSSHGSEPF